MNDITPKQGNIAFEYDRKLKDCIQGTTLYFLKAGELFLEIRNNKFYKTLGYNNISEYAGSLGISIGWAYNAMRIYSKWILEFKESPDIISKIPYDKLLIIDSITTNENKSEMLAQANELPRSELKKIVKEEKGDIEECTLIYIKTAIECQNYNNGECLLHRKPCKIEQQIKSIYHGREINRN